MTADIGSGFWWQQGPPTLHQSETCYVHHSLADIDTEKLLTDEINQVAWPTFFTIFLGTFSTKV